MNILFKKIHHLIRYFVILGVVSFAGYVMRWQDQAFLALCGPPIYLSYELKSLITPILPPLPASQTFILYGILLPVTIFYYGLCGFLTKQLWNERGFVRTASLLTFLAFLVFVHWKSWLNLSSYLAF